MILGASLMDELNIWASTGEFICMTGDGFEETKAVGVGITRRSCSSSSHDLKKNSMNKYLV